MSLVDVLPVLTSGFVFFIDGLNWFDTLQFNVGIIPVSMLDIVCAFLCVGFTFNFIRKMITPEGGLSEGIGDPIDFYWYWHESGHDDDDEDDDEEGD